MKRIGLLLIASALLSGCSSTVQPSAEQASVSHAPPRNEALLLLADGQKSTRVVADNLLGEPKLPGGTIGEYESDGKRYQMFVLRADSNQDAALLLLLMRNAMPDSKYLAHMGGYFGTHKGQQLYVFSKQQYLAGLIGLSNDEADPIARRLAARLK